MGLDFDYLSGQTPLSEDEKDGLLIHSITTRGDLDEFEQLGLEKASEWLLKKKFTAHQILTFEFVKKIHKKMFSDIWKWAGEFRTTEKNIGVDPVIIPTQLKNLLDDCKFWIENKIFNYDEIAIRLSHRLVSIHPFVNGNGRHSRLMADVLINKGFGKPYFTWGSVNLIKEGEARKNYLIALREADNQNYEQLLDFARL